MTFADMLGTFIDWARDLLADVIDEVTGSVSTSVQAVLDIKEMDCGGNWILYIKTATHAAGAALFLLLTPSFEEILESYLHPKTGRRGGRRGRRGERERRPGRGAGLRLFFGGGIPDIDNAIADRIVGRGFFKGRQVGTAEWIFWTGIDVADAILWQWLLLEATNIFTTTWQSGLMESGQCKAHSSGSARLETSPRTGWTQAPMWFTGADLPVNVEVNLSIANNGSITINAPWDYAEGWATATGFFTITSGNGTGPAIFNLGFLVEGFISGGPAETLLVGVQTASIGPNQSRTVEVSAFGTMTKHRNWQCFAIVDTLKNLCNAQVSGTFQLAIAATALIDE